MSGDSTDVQEVIRDTMPNFDLSALLQPTLMAPEMPAFANPNWTSEIIKHIVTWILEFEGKLDVSHEVGARLVNFGQTVQFYLEAIEYCDSPLLRIKGSTEDGLPVELIQHVNQLSILLIKLPKKNPDTPKRKIGFHTERSDSD